MMKANDDDVLEREEEKDDIVYQQKQNLLEEKSEEEILPIKKVKEINKTKKIEEADKKIATILYQKGLSENLIQTLIDTGFTDEHTKLLKILNLSDKDIDNLQDLWQGKIAIDESDDFISSTISDESSSDGRVHLSPNSVYLKKALSKPLIQALREIVMKKPADPVEYLAHCLLHFKICEERSMQEKQRDLELLLRREILERKEVEEIEDFIEEKEEEEEIREDWNYLHYDGLL